MTTATLSATQSRLFLTRATCVRQWINGDDGQWFVCNESRNWNVEAHSFSQTTANDTFKPTLKKSLSLCAYFSRSFPPFGCHEDCLCIGETRLNHARCVARVHSLPKRKLVVSHSRYTRARVKETSRCHATRNSNWVGKIDVEYAVVWVMNEKNVCTCIV